MSDRYDVIIIGSGAGGGTLLSALAPTGKKILVLERGQFLPREKENWDSRSVLLEGRYKTDETWLDRDGNAFHPSTHYWVGGNTKVYGAALVRFRKENFTGMTHAGGKSVPWPIAYEELEPYYTRAESLYQVHGERGSDPTEPPASGPYPYPAVSHEAPMAEVVEALRGANYRPFPMPLGIQIDEQSPEKSRCIRCNTCDGFPCLVGGKADAQVIAVMPALARDNVTLLTGAKVLRLETDARGRAVNQVVVERDGQTEQYRGDVVVVSAGAVNSAAILLRSASDRHPNGLANGSGMVGRNYMAHLNSIFFAITTRRNDTVFQKTLALNDFYFRSDDWDHPLGHISMVGKSDGNFLKAGAKLAPLFVLERVARHAFDFWLTSEDLPDRDNRVTVERDGQIRLSYTPNNLEGHARLTARLKRIVKELLPLGITIAARMPVGATAHQCGTVRFGTDPATSVLDVHCKAHQVDNLYVVDAGFFPSSAAVNPALTIMANALRVADHLKNRLAS